MIQTFEQAVANTVQWILANYVVKYDNLERPFEKVREQPDRRLYWANLAWTAANLGNITIEDVAPVVISKQKDYGYRNIEAFGLDGLVVRVHDKVARVANLKAKNSSPHNESLTDSYRDIVGYSILAIMWLDETFLSPLEEDWTCPEEPAQWDEATLRALVRDEIARLLGDRTDRPWTVGGTW